MPDAVRYIYSLTVEVEVPWDDAKNVAQETPNEIHDAIVSWLRRIGADATVTFERVEDVED